MSVLNELWGLLKETPDERKRRYARERSGKLPKGKALRDLKRAVAEATERTEVTLTDGRKLKL